MTDTIDAMPAKTRKAAEEPRVSARLIESVEVQIEAFLGSRVFLGLHVRVRSEWRENERFLSELGIE